MVPDYVADISTGLGHINNYVIVSGITIEYGKTSYLPLPGTSSQPGPEPGEVALAGLQDGPCRNECRDPPRQLPTKEEHIWLCPRPWPQGTHVARKGEWSLPVASAPFVFWQE